MGKNKKIKRLHRNVQNVAPASKYRFRLNPLWVLIGLSIAVFVIRFQTYNEPFERDIASHSVIGREILNGRQLYSDLWDSKPPAIFVTYAVFNLIFGMGPLAVYFLGVTAAIITLVGVYKVGFVFGGKSGGLWSAAFWTFICSDLWLWANQPNIEVCINACLVWALYLFVIGKEDKYQVIRWITVGALFALATLYKPVAIVFAVLISVAYLCCNLNSAKAFRNSFVHVSIVAVTGAAIWFAVLGYFAITNRFEIFYNTIFEYGSFYTKSRGGSLFSNITKGFSAEKFFYRPTKNLLIPAILTSLGLLVGIVKTQRKKWILLFSFLLAAPLAISLPGRFYPHYYQLWLIPLVIGSGSFIASLVITVNKNKTSLPSILTGSISLFILLIMVLSQYKYSADEWSTLKYGPQFPITRKIAQDIDKILEPDETLYVWGINPEIYFWTKRRPPTGIIWSTDLIEGPLAEEHTKRVLEDLKAKQPKMVAINMLQLQTPRNHPVILWILENYRPLPEGSDRGILYNRPFFKLMTHKTKI